MKTVHSEGHQIGTHSWTHAKWFDFWTSARMRRDMEKANQLVGSITGAPVVFFRPPYGVTNPPLARAIRALDMITVGWSFRSLDTVKGAGEMMEKKIMDQVREHDILLFHDTVDGLPQMLDRVIPQLKEKGFSFELIQI